MADKRILQPPFEKYNEFDISDHNGHVLTAESQEIAEELLEVLNRAFQKPAQTDG